MGLSSRVQRGTSDLESVLVQRMSHLCLSVQTASNRPSSDRANTASPLAIPQRPRSENVLNKHENSECSRSRKGNIGALTFLYK